MQTLFDWSWTLLVLHLNAQSSASLQDWEPACMDYMSCKENQYATALNNKVAECREMAVCISVDFAGGCTEAAGQVSHWVTRARSFASGSFPQPRGAPHCDLPIKLHMCQRTRNPSESFMCVGLWMWQWSMQATSCDKHNNTERGSSEKDSWVLSLTLSNMLPLMAQ